ncbi:hypothetical protein [Alkalibaculum bacchi]|uniref:hypothetical protein n=1 Tax=Alkalibaculum bacchi TaxID=645887 RepID=UPI0026EF5836|nr:hypothetical protein [Alkalibaculum bacchi]
MDINISIIVILLFIITTQFILNIYIIKKNNIMGYDMGPKIGEVFPMEFINDSKILNSYEIKKIAEGKKHMCFVSIGCESCESVLEYLKKNHKEDHENIALIVEGNKEEAEEWYKKNNYDFYSFYIDMKNMTQELKINRFPFIFILEDGTVKSKGPLFEEYIENYLTR